MSPLEERQATSFAVEVCRETQMRLAAGTGDAASARFPRDCTGLICPGAVSGQLPDIRPSDQRGWRFGNVE